MNAFLTILALTFAPSAFAGMTHPAPTMPKSFDALKNLVGTWEGSSKMGDKVENVTVTYELTSGGTVIMERLMPGTPHEMVSVYHKEGKSLGMTHYCALGNQPHMKLKNSDATTMSFEMDMKTPVGITSPNEPHMHALKLTMADANSLNQEWTHYMNGKAGQSVVFAYKRKP